MNPRIFRGKTVEEATEEALKTLKKDLENLEIKKLDTGRNAILGLGGHPAEIEVYIIGEPIDNIVDEIIFEKSIYHLGIGDTNSNLLIPISRS